MNKLVRILGALAAFGAMAWAASAPSHADAAGSCDVADASIDGEEQAFLQLINTYRAGKGLAPLAIDGALNRSAAWMANDLAGRSNFGHTDSLGRSPWVRMPDCGVSWPGGENLAAGTDYSSAQTALNAWIASPSHRDVMLTADFKTIGIARVFWQGSYYGWYWVTDFGYVANGAAAATPVSTPAPAPAPTLAPPPPPPIAPAGAQPRPVAPVATPAPRALSLPAGLSLVTWNGDYLSPDDVFGPASNWISMVYVYDLGTEQWLRWGPALNPELRTLTELRDGVQYWVIATRAVEVEVD